MNVESSNAVSFLYCSVLDKNLNSSLPFGKQVTEFACPSRFPTNPVLKKNYIKTSYKMF